MFGVIRCSLHASLRVAVLAGLSSFSPLLLFFMFMCRLHHLHMPVTVFVNLRGERCSRVVGYRFTVVPRENILAIKLVFCRFLPFSRLLFVLECIGYVAI